MKTIGLIAGTLALVFGVLGLVLTILVGLVLAAPAESMPTPDRFPAPISTLVGLLVMVNIFGAVAGGFPIMRMVFFGILAGTGWFVQSWARQSTAAEADET